MERAGRRVLLGLAMMGALWFVLSLQFGYRANEAFGALALGWVRFFSRSLQDVSINWSGIGMVMVCSAVSWALIRMFTRSTRKTGAVVGGFWLLFALSIGASGIFSKGRELYSSDEPLVVRRENPYVTLRNAHLAIRMAMEDGGGDAEEARRALENWRAKFGRGEWEALNVVIVSDGAGKLLAAAFVPRGQTRGMGVYVGGKDFSQEFSSDYATQVMSALTALEGEKSNEPLEKRLRERIPEAAWVRDGKLTIDVGFY
jgi:hypothetical protein